MFIFTRIFCGAVHLAGHDGHINIERLFDVLGSGDDTRTLHS